MKKEAIRYHSRILFAGFLRTLLGTGAAATGALAVYGFKMTTIENGYTAVCSFIVALAFAVIALALVYAQGANGKLRSVKKGRFSA